MTEDNKLTLHLVVTSLCDRYCYYCCNKEYDIHNLEYVTDEDFKKCDLLCLTGGEPFTYANPNNLARRYKQDYPNIKNVIVYTNAFDLMKHLDTCNFSHAFRYINGLSVSVKDTFDAEAFRSFIYYKQFTTWWNSELKLNRLYDFTGYIDKSEAANAGFEYIKREWQKEFVPAPNCIFRRGN